VTVKPDEPVVTVEKVGIKPVEVLEVVVIELDAAEGEELPTEFVATTVNV
jgi:hypothetical protein